MNDNIKTRAIVTASLEVVCPSKWSGKTTMEQVRKQAIDDAKNILNIAFETLQTNHPILVKNIVVETITTKDKE